MPQNQVSLFFYVNGQFLIHGCDLADAENYGDFLIYPDSHFEIWEKYYAKRYPVDFDFFPAWPCGVQQKHAGISDPV